ncbi:ester cyclase [Streptomyces sp. Li-HN-5-11]|uniref:ester cyclase n=1 Tax=Streptomyces sp. Li-HN-5-11 TaxID=3075432 RepID=UPI0028A8ADD4|nr:ester cyclase [Streptomyces sp. Li-HN-5-11]WNM31950.1 ester cyclase [Streptomyces sp. Li-HN-5-11]
MSNLEDNKALVRAFFRTVDTHDRETAFQILDADHTLELSGSDQPLDREGHWRLASFYHDAFTDMTHRPEVQIAEGDMVATFGTITGKHSGPLHGVPATGKSVSLTFVNTARIRDGKICGMFGLSDNASLQQQLGVAENVAYHESSDEPHHA